MKIMSHRQPKLTVDVIIKCGEGIILIERKNPPYGWAIPGGFVDYGETVEDAALREAKEETSLDVKNLKQFYVYSDPHRDPRGHTVSVVFTGEADGTPKAGGDAKNIGIFTKTILPDNIAFDHKKILTDYFRTMSKIIC